MMTEEIKASTWEAQVSSHENLDVYCTVTHGTPAEPVSLSTDLQTLFHDDIFTIWYEGMSL